MRGIDLGRGRHMYAGFFTRMGIDLADRGGAGTNDGLPRMRGDDLTSAG